MSERQTFNGELSMSPYGNLTCSLFPIKDSGFLDCDDDSLMDLFRDMWRFFHSRHKTGKVQGKSVRKGITPVQKLKTLEFAAGYLRFTMIENARNPDTRVTLIVSVPWACQMVYDDAEEPG